MSESAYRQIETAARHSTHGRAALTDSEIAEVRDRLDRLARMLDSAVRIPGTSVRVGADAALNLIPGVGTLAAKGISSYLLWEARRMGVPTATLLRMAANIGIDTVISIIPVVGWFGDVFWRANTRNIALLRRHLVKRQREGRAT
jgi:Domain of unknown function (DUF4112)